MKFLVMLLLITSLFIIGCSGRISSEVELIIISYEEITPTPNKSGWIFHGYCQQRTTVKTTNGFIYTICGNYGAIGDTIKGYWTSGRRDYRGFERIN